MPPGVTPDQVAAAESAASARAMQAGRAAGSGPSTGVGRWTALPPAETDPTVRAVTSAELLLDRYGVLTRGSVVSEDVPGGFAAVYRVLAAAEEAGKVRRGYFVEGLGASQFASTGAVDRLRSMSRLPGGGPSVVSGRAMDGRPGGADVATSGGPGGRVDPFEQDEWASARSGSRGIPAWSAGRDRRPSRGDERSAPPTLVLAASDPASPYGASIRWPERGVVDPEENRPKGHQPGRKAGALVVLVDGDLVLYVERGGKTMLCWSEASDALQAAADALALAVREGALGRLTVEKADGAAILGSKHPLVQALSQAGFHMTPRGLRLRR
jgi:ATP-dependent Lhr-like helicase